MAFDTDLILLSTTDGSVSGTDDYLKGTGLTTGATAVKELDGAAIAKLAVPVFVVSITPVMADTLYCDLQMSVDGSAYRNVARVTVPAGGKGQFSAPIGGFEAMFRRTPANVQCKVLTSTSGHVGSTSITVNMAITNGEPTLGGKTPADALLP